MENLKTVLESKLAGLEALRAEKAAEFDRQRDAALETVDREIEKTEKQLAAELEITPGALRKQRKAAAKVEVVSKASA